MTSNGSSEPVGSGSAAETVRTYYEQLRTSEALSPFFVDNAGTAKFGVGESLYGFEAVTTALREQTETTTEWTVESHRLEVADRGAVASFTDEVTLAWTDQTTGTRRRFETRWSGTLYVVDDDGAVVEVGSDSSAEADSRHWRFHTLHVSAPHQF